MSQNRCNPYIWWFLLHQVIFYLSLKKQSSHFRKFKPDDKVRDWLTLSYSARERPSSWERFRMDFFRTSFDRISHRIHIVRMSCSQLPTRYGILCLLVVVVYQLRGLKFVYPTINLAFLGIIIKVKLPARFCWHSFEWFFRQISSDAKYLFLSSPWHCNRGLIVVIEYYFQITM